MGNVTITVGKLAIPIYLETKAKNLPMFAKNREHQCSSGRPYPNKAMLKVNRDEKVDKKYEVITLENEYLIIEILPESGVLTVFLWKNRGDISMNNNTVPATSYFASAYNYDSFGGYDHAKNAVQFRLAPSCISR